MSSKANASASMNPIDPMMEINRENLSCDLIRFHSRGRQRRLAEIRAIHREETLNLSVVFNRIEQALPVEDRRGHRSRDFPRMFSDGGSLSTIGLRIRLRGGQVCCFYEAHAVIAGTACSFSAVRPRSLASYIPTSS